MEQIVQNPKTGIQYYEACFILKKPTFALQWPWKSYDSVGEMEKDGHNVDQKWSKKLPLMLFWAKYYRSKIFYYINLKENVDKTSYLTKKNYHFEFEINIHCARWLLLSNATFPDRCVSDFAPNSSPINSQ